MKQSKQKLFKIIFSVLLLAGSRYEGFSQTNKSERLGRFSILVETVEKNIKFTSMKGCAWKELTFTLENDKVQTIDRYGLITSDEDPNKKNASSDFLFTVQRIKDGIEFRGKKGTAWERLSFRCPK